MRIVSDRAIRFFEFFFGHGIGGIAIFPFIIFPSYVDQTPQLVNHERIHLRQQMEMLVIPFFVLYLIEFYTKGYRNISFEKEAYANDMDLTYLKSRKLFAFKKYF